MRNHDFLLGYSVFSCSYGAIKEPKKALSFYINIAIHDFLSSCPIILFIELIDLFPLDMSMFTIKSKFITNK